MGTVIAAHSLSRWPTWLASKKEIKNSGKSDGFIQIEYCGYNFLVKNKMTATEVVNGMKFTVKIAKAYSN